MTSRDATLGRAGISAGRTATRASLAAAAGGRLLRARWAAPGLCAGVIAAVYVALAVVFSHPVVPPGSDAYGYTGATTLHGLMRFDGAWYARIAMHGYAPLAG